MPWFQKFSIDSDESIVKLRFFLILLGASNFVFADPVYHIQQMDKDVPVDRLAGPGVKIHKLDPAAPGGWSLPSVEERETAFSRADLRSDIADWDQLDRDMLYLRARSMTLEVLSSQYPKLIKEKLKNLKTSIASTKKAAK